MPAWQIAIVAGSLAVFGIIVALIFWAIKRKRESRDTQMYNLQLDEPIIHMGNVREQPLAHA